MRLKTKDKKIHLTNTAHKKAGLTVWMAEANIRNTIWYQQRHFTIIKRSTHHEDIIPSEVPIIRASNHMKEKFRELKGTKSTVTVRGFLSVSYETCRPKNKKNNKDLEDSNNTINQVA